MLSITRIMAGQELDEKRVYYLDSSKADPQ